MITRFRKHGFSDTYPDIQLKITVDLNSDCTCVDMLLYESPDPVYNMNADIIGHEGGYAEAVIKVRGIYPPTNREFSDAFHGFIRDNGILWTSELEQDMLWEVYGATQIRP